MIHSSGFRKTTQHLAPSRHPPLARGMYDIYPGFPIGQGKILEGFAELARVISGSGSHTIAIDGYCGVMWEDFRSRLDRALREHGVVAEWYSADAALLTPDAVAELTEPFLGGDDPLFGTRCTLGIRDFFHSDRLSALVPDAGDPVKIAYGTGASLAAPEAFLVYVDVPKNEIQFRSRSGSITNFGVPAPAPPKKMYKRFYFVDWPVLNRHRRTLLPAIDLIVDAQRPDIPVMMEGDDFRRALDLAGTHPFRVRPWFEPGPWGGQWIRNHIPQVAADVPNYAWSFELISPENGIAFESDGILLEVSFDFLMMHNHREILGVFASRFGYEFPIRYDFLDTFDGGNLSLQCHPRPDYIHRHFGETFTQDECYYILDCVPGADVYLGFNERADPDAFRRDLEDGFRKGIPVPVDRHVRRVKAHKHDLFLIPNGTIHCSGVNNLVLEISATPYIFTFKMYDWMRMDLDGNPRPLNIDRAMENLYFDRAGGRVDREHIAQPRVLSSGPGWQCEHLPTHPLHFYDVHRYTISRAMDVAMQEGCHVLNLVEGSSVVVETTSGFRQRFNYAETFVVPAAVGQYRMISDEGETLKLVGTFFKPDARPFATPEGAL